MKITKEEISEIPEAWDDSELKVKLSETKPRKKMDFVTKFFLISLGAFILAMAVLLFSMLNQSSNFSEKRIVVSAVGPVSITSGEDGNISVTIENNNKIPINEAYIIATYDSGENSSGDKNLINRRVDIGDVLPKSSVTKSLDFRVFGAEGIIKEIRPVLYYKVPKSKAEFNKQINLVTVAIKTSPVSINVKNLREVHQNHDVTFTVTVRNNTSNRINDLIVSARNPNDFIYSSSSLPLKDNTPSWDIGTLNGNSEKTMTMTGKLIGEIGSTPAFTFFTGVSDPEKNNTATDTPNTFENYNTLDNIYSKVEKTILVTGQYLDFFISSDNSTENYTIAPNNSLILELDYRNNLAYSIDRAYFTALVSGSGFDFEDIQAENAIFYGNNQSIVWSEDSSPEFIRIPAFGTGKMYLNIRVNNEAKEGDEIRLILNAKGERNYEQDVSNSQDTSFERVWRVRKN
ncbi:hypothetical protein SDC9_21651 [bioreactor metagenome]|uniref:DUF11 domain-containing protein n=1 Tax=bioreactor metagenome TaxID=1076179 RepID=A0A644UAC9_9ZZZZ|nr:hypothetical protein [Candidatus Elulimicrobiales bacterium]